MLASFAQFLYFVATSLVKLITISYLKRNRYINYTKQNSSHAYIYICTFTCIHLKKHNVQ